MFKNYLIVGLRNLMRHKFYSALNILGLSVGIACALLPVLYVDYELGYNQHHEKIDRIYQVMREVTDTGGTRFTMRTNAVAPVLKQNFPEIEHAIRVFMRPLWVSYGERGFTIPLAVADKEVMDIFTIPLIQGDAKTGLDEPNSVFLSQSFAQKLFGDDDPIGKVVSVKHKWIQDDYTVTGIFKDAPKTSTHILRFDFLTATFSDRARAINNSWKTLRWERWLSNDPVAPLTTYLLLKEGADAQALEDKLHPFVAAHHPENLNAKIDYYLQPLSRVHLFSKQDYGVAEGNAGDIMQCYTLFGIGMLVLVIACFNYINLVTARSANRMREVGLRKVVGADRAQLLFQFLGESVVVTALAFLLAVLFAQAALPFFNLAIGANLALADLSVTAMVLFPLSIVLIVGILAGSYPALVLSGFAPIRALKGTFANSGQRAWLREILVVIQFCASVVLMLITLVIYEQTEYMLQKDLGYRQDRVVVMPMFWEDRSLHTQRASITQELRKHANISSTTITAPTPGTISTVDIETLRAEDGKEFKFYRANIDHDYLKTLDLDVIAGTALPRFERTYRRLNETTWETSVLLNETAVRMVGWEDPVGQILYGTGGDEGQFTVAWKVVGVIRDFHNRSLRHDIEPQVFQLGGLPHHVVIQLGTGNMDDTIEHIGRVWKTFLPARPFKFYFLNDYVEASYRQEQMMRTVYGFFSGLSIFIGCLGMLGLVSYAAQQRTKEIGVRKVLGASVGNLVMLLAKNFLVLALVANVVAWPLAYLLATSWLEQFTYRMNLGLVLFVITGLLTLLIVFLTVSGQAWRAARANPVTSLRYE